MESCVGVTLNNDKMGPGADGGANPNKPTTPHSPNGIAHSTCDITGTDGLINTVKAERGKFKLDWAAWVADYKANGFTAAYDGTFTSADGSTAVNVTYEDE